MTDNDLIALFKKGDGSACEQLLNRYKPVVLRLSRRYFLIGGDAEDLVQEGMCGLYSAMQNFREGDFYSYACTCIKNRIADALRKSLSIKQQALNSSVPIDGEALFLQAADNPEAQIISSESVAELENLMRAKLSPMEYKVMRLYVDGCPISEICSSLGMDYKSADNAISRSKRKLQKILGG